MPFYFTCFTAALLALIPVAALAQTPPAPTPTASSAAPSEVLLKYKLTPGEVLRYRITDSMKGAMTVGSQNLPINDQSVESLTATVEKIDPATGNATLRQQFHTTETMSGKQSTNSSPSDISYSVVLAPTGQVISQDLGAKANAELKAIGWNFHSLLSSSYFSQDAAFPTHAVKIADIWSHADTLGQPGIPGYTNESLTGLGTISGHQTASNRRALRRHHQLSSEGDSRTYLAVHRPIPRNRNGAVRPRCRARYKATHTPKSLLITAKCLPLFRRATPRLWGR